MEQQNRLPGRNGTGNGRHSSLTHPILKGNMHRTLVVKEPGGIYSQAIFILKPEACSQEIGRRELLRQAREAAGMLLPDPPRKGRAIILFISGFLLGALCAAGTLWGLGMIAFH